MGACGALGLFVSILCHEVCHSVVARSYGLPVKSITLFIFGGVSETEKEPPSPKVEFLMAAAGPALSIVLGLVFYGIHQVGIGQGWATPVSGVLSYLASINLILAAFNLVPGFPLDGGRMLRSALWKAKGDLKWATRTASQSGAFFGWVLIALGVFSFFRGNFIGGIWWFLIGLFLKDAARMAFQQLMIQESLKGETIHRFVTQNPITVSPSLALDRWVDDYVYQHHFKMFPVVQDSKLLGCVSAESLKQIPRPDWAKHSIRELVKPCTSANSVGPDTDVRKAISVMNQSGNSRLIVLEGQRLVGVVTLKDLLEFLALKLELEGQPTERHLKVAS
jgi:Zn-dependent protease/predicted transcriptional regulator